MDLALPQEMVDGVEQFKEFYEHNTKHRKLGWVYALGTCHIKANFDAKPIELILSTFQASLLLLFNTGNIPADLHHMQEGTFVTLLLPVINRVCMYVLVVFPNLSPCVMRSHLTGSHQTSCSCASIIFCAHKCGFAGKEA